MSSGIDPLMIELDDDPNAASRNQVALKRVETAIRRYCDCSLLLEFDGIALMDDQVQVKAAMLKLKKILEQKAADETERVQQC